MDAESVRHRAGKGQPSLTQTQIKTPSAATATASASATAGAGASASATHPYTHTPTSTSSSKATQRTGTPKGTDPSEYFLSTLSVQVPDGVGVGVHGIDGVGVDVDDGQGVDGVDTSDTTQRNPIRAQAQRPDESTYELTIG